MQGLPETVVEPRDRAPAERRVSEGVIERDPSEFALDVWTGPGTGADPDDRGKHLVHLVHRGLDPRSDVHDRARCVIDGQAERPNGVVDVDVVTGLLAVSEHRRLSAREHR